MTKSLKTFLFIFMLSLPFASNAADVKNAIFSPACSADDIKKIAEDALVNISERQNWGGQASGFLVTLNTDKMTFDTLTKAMQEKGCFQASQ